MHENEMEQPGEQGAHHTAVPNEHGPEVQQRPGKQPVGHGDTGSSVSLPSNPNPDYLTTVEMENTQLRSHLARANKQIEEVLARLSPLATDVNVRKRQGGSHKPIQTKSIS